MKQRDGRDRRGGARSKKPTTPSTASCPTTIVRAIMNINPARGHDRLLQRPEARERRRRIGGRRSERCDRQERMAAMRLEMFAAAENLEFEKAARLRDELKKLESIAGADGGSEGSTSAFEPYASNGKRKMGSRPRGAAKTDGLRGTRPGRRYKTR